MICDNCQPILYTLQFRHGCIGHFRNQLLFTSTDVSDFFHPEAKKSQVKNFSTETYTVVFEGSTIRLEIFPQNQGFMAPWV